ncbi:MAG: thioredoxin family protein [Nanoarchaeota archaeon]
MKKLYLILLLIMILMIAGCSPIKHTKESLDSLSNCLADKNVKEYGAFWCPNCAKQQKMFGSSYDTIKERQVYVECDPRGENPQPELCLEKNVLKYPDWEFSDGTRLVGVQDLETLATQAGCEIPVLK